MLLLELGDIDERFGKTIYIFQLLAESFFKCYKIKREVSLIKMRRVNGDCRLKRTTNHKRVDSCLGKFGQVHGMANQYRRKWTRLEKFIHTQKLNSYLAASLIKLCRVGGDCKLKRTARRAIFSCGVRSVSMNLSNSGWLDGIGTAKIAAKTKNMEINI